MRLCSLKSYQETFFAPGSAPSVATLRAQIKARKLPGKLHCGRYYVDLDQIDASVRLAATLAERREQLEKSPALEGLI